MSREARAPDSEMKFSRVVSGSGPTRETSAEQIEPPDEPRLSAERGADPESVARTICLRMLDTRARTRVELATTLRRRGVPDAAAMAVLDRFTELGLIDDAAYAQAFTQARHANRSQAGPAIAAQLRRRGIEDSVIGEALAQLDPASESRAARSLVQSRLARMSALDAPTRLRRLMALLARRGYSAGVSAQAIRDVMGAQGDAGLADLD